MVINLPTMAQQKYLMLLFNVFFNEKVLIKFFAKNYF